MLSIGLLAVLHTQVQSETCQVDSVGEHGSFSMSMVDLQPSGQLLYTPVFVKGFFRLANVGASV